MAYDTKLAKRIRTYIENISNLKIEEKNMFGGLAFMINGKMCICVSEENLMCRFDPEKQEELISKEGYLSMVMKNKELQGYCYIRPEGFQSDRDLKFYIDLCLEFNSKAKSSKKNNTSFSKK